VLDNNNPFFAITLERKKENEKWPKLIEQHPSFLPYSTDGDRQGTQRTEIVAKLDKISFDLL